MDETFTGPVRSLTSPPPLPPRNRPVIPPPLPPRRPTIEVDTIDNVSLNASSLKVTSTSASTKPFVSATRVTEKVTITQSTQSTSPSKQNATTSTAKSIVSSTISQLAPASTSQNGPTVPSLLLSLVLKEPVERSHGRISLITSIQSFFQSTVPAPPPFEYSTLVDHALLASQIALHDPHTRQQKRLPLVVSLSIGAFLVAATAIIPRYFGWMMLAGATWFGPGRFLMQDMWYISAAFVALALLMDVFPMLTLFMLFWTGFIAVSRVMDERGKKGGVGREQTAIQLMHNTAQVLQSGGDINPVALDIVQNFTEWWAFRQSEPEKKKRAEEKVAKEEKKIAKLQRVETEKEMKKARLEEKEAERLRKIEEAKELKRVKTEEKEAERLQKKQKQEEELNLKRVVSEEKEKEKQRKKEQDLEAKRLKLEEKEMRKRKELEDKERQRREKSEADFLKRQEEEKKMLNAHLVIDETSQMEETRRQEEQTRMLTAHLIPSQTAELELLKRKDEERRMLTAHLVSIDEPAGLGGIDKEVISERTDVETIAPIPEVLHSMEPEPHPI